MVLHHPWKVTWQLVLLTTTKLFHLARGKIPSGLSPRDRLRTSIDNCSRDRSERLTQVGYAIFAQFVLEPMNEGNQLVGFHLFDGIADQHLNFSEFHCEKDWPFPFFSSLVQAKTEWKHQITLFVFLLTQNPHTHALLTTAMVMFFPLIRLRSNLYTKYKYIASATKHRKARNMWRHLLLIGLDARHKETFTERAKTNNK